MAARRFRPVFRSQPCFVVPFVRRPPGHRCHGRARPELSHPAHQARDRLPCRRTHGHHDAATGRQRLEDPRPADRGGQQARRRRHLARAGDADRRTRRLHHRPDPARRVPPAVHHQDQLGPGQGHQLRDQRHRLRLRHRGAGRQPDQELERVRCLRQGQSGQAHLRLDRHDDQPAPDDRTHRAAAGHPVAARALQGQRRAVAGGARQPSDGDRRFDRFRAAGGVRQAARAQHLGREATRQVPGRAHAEGTGDRHRAELALRHRRTQGHAAGGGEEAARCLQASDGRAELCRCAGSLRHAADLHEFERLHQVRADDVHSREGVDREAGAGQAAVRQGAW